MPDSLTSWLQAARLLPPGSTEENLVDENLDLLPSIAAVWRRLPPPCRRRDQKQFARRLMWLEGQTRVGARLTVGVPSQGTGFQLASSQPDARLCWWPAGIPRGKWCAIVSSRLGRRLDQRPEWFAAFRDACNEIRLQDAVVLVGEGTTTAPFLQRIAERFGLPLLTVHEPKRAEDWVSWLKKVACSAPIHHSGGRHDCFLSPLVPSEGNEQSHDSTFGPLCDQATVAWAAQVYVLHLRRGGNLEPLVRRRLADLESPEVFVALGPRLVPEAVADSLPNVQRMPGQLAESAMTSSVDVGEVEGHGCSDLPGTIDRGSCSLPGEEVLARTPPARSRIYSWKEFTAHRAGRSWPFLTHCTRACAGPWPDQSRAEYLDELIFQNSPSDRSAEAALARIVRQQKMTGSGTAIRGGTPVVCFTEASLAELKSLRSFQPQRQRWDFEPYGICLLREWLVSLGARPVIYGDEHDWARMAEEDRPFFQLRGTRRRKRPHSWMVEREWRYLGDLDLAYVDATEAWIFAATEAEAARMAEVSRWPIVVCTETANAARSMNEKPSRLPMTIQS